MNDYIYDIAINATPLWDRGLGHLMPSAKNGHKTDEANIDRWIAILGSRELLSKRLKCNDIGLTGLPRLFRECSGNTKQPSWCRTFKAVLKYYKPCEAPAMKVNGDYYGDSAIPFEEILFPFIRVYQSQLQKKTGRYLNVLTRQAKEYLDRQLLSHIGFIAGLTIGAEFYKFRFKTAPASAIESIWVKQPISNTIYKDFIDHMYNEGMITIFNQHPVLARLLCQSVDHCIYNTNRFCRHFFNDFLFLKSKFNLKTIAPEGSVCELSGQSDRHHNGQTVLECMLSSGEKLMYKPRNILPEIAYNNFIRYFNSFEPGIQIKDIAALNKKDHGWVEYVQSAPCLSAGEAKRYYKRVGILLSILHVLSVTDIHFENIIASGEHPVVVDLETLLDKVKAQSNPAENENSLLRIGLLPRIQEDANNIQPDKSGLCAEANTAIKVFAWKNINTDQMQLIDDDTNMLSNHRVRIKGKMQSAEDYLTSIMDGFTSGYFNFLKNKNEILKNGKILKQFDNLQLRTIVRNTETYAKIHLHLLHPEYLVNGIERSIELEWLARPLMGTDSPRSWRMMVYEQERLAMEQLDIPHFTSFKNKYDLEYMDDLDYDFFYRKRDSEIIRNNLKQLSKNDYAKQMKIIAGTIKSRFETQLITPI